MSPSPWRRPGAPWPWSPPGGPLLRWSLLAALVLLQLSPALAEECTQGFSVVAPEVGVPGRPTAVLVTLHGGPDAVTPVAAVTRVTPVRNVTLRLRGAGSKVYVQDTVQIQGRGIIPLHVPQDASGLCTLQTVVECPASADSSPSAASPCPLTATADLRLLPPVRDVIVRSDRTHAAPGDTVGFWILALSHDMTLPSDVLASVSVKDPAGTKVAVWEDVPLDQGVRSFSFSLSPGAALGRWRLEVAVEDAAFGADLNVSLTGPDEAWSWGWGWSWARSMAAQQPPQPQQPAAARSSAAENEVAMAEEHFVELRFGNGMRRVYKPNMPFIGKVEAVSSERSVRVRIKLYDNTTAIYSQDVEISSGEATFVVPSIMADSTRIALQAELVSVEGKEIESHYVLAREDIYRWNSTSQCFLLVEGVERTMEVGEEASVRVLSTCPCRTDLHYVVTTQGHVTYWSDQQGQQGTTLDTADSGGAACQTNITFTVDPTMAPVSRLLVYYVTAGGEPVSDVTTFDVRLLDKRMSLSFEQKPSWAPGETMDVEILAEDNSLICLVGGRVPNGGKSVPASAVAGAEGSAGQSSSRAVDFLDAGLSLYERQCVAPGPGGGVRFHQSRADPRPVGQDALNGLRRLQLDQLWLWRCLNYTNRVAAEGVSLTVPEGAGQWTLWGLSLSPTSGLRFSDAATFTVFRPLGVDFRLPRSLRVGEVLEVSVKIANNLNSCVDVSALLSLKDGAHFQSSGLGFVSERLRLGPHGATSLVVRIQATAQSSNNLTAEVIAHAATSCQAPAVYGAETDATARVVRFASFRVQPEGLTRVHTESAYFCANEHIMISTSENFRFDFVPAPRNREAVVLEVRAGQGARVALSDQMTPTDWMYQVVIGDADNTISWIGRGKHEYSVHLSSAKTPGILSPVKERTFWVSWEQSTVRFGRGAVVGKDLLLKWRLVKKMKVNHIGFASSWGQTADFRVWNFNDEAGYSQVLHLDVPRSVVPGSERGTLLVAGGMALPGAGVGAGGGHPRPAPSPVTGGQIPEPLQDNDMNTAEDGAGLQQPLPVPGRDAAESSSLAATVSAFAPLPGLRHLPVNSSSAAEYQQRVLDSLRLRLQDLVAFLHPDGSFGDHKTHGSHRNTVAVLELLTEAQAYFSVDAGLVADAKRWVQSRQAEDGSFASPLADLRDGAEDAGVPPPAPQAATWSATTATTSGTGAADAANASSDALQELEQRIETTAETLVTLLEVGVETERDSETVVRARYFLERHTFTPRGPVALAALCLALVRSRSDVAGAALARMRAASVNQEGDFSWPAQQQDAEQQQQRGGRSGADWLADDALQQDSSSRRRDPLRLNVREFRASLYALLTYSFRRDLSAAEPVARYLFYRAHLLDIHPELSYLSVKAFSAFGQLARDEHRSLTVSLATSGMELTDTLELRPGSPPASLVLPSLPTKVFVYATGAGCATVQGLVQYSTYLPRSSTPLLDLWAGVEDEIPPPRNSLEELEGKQPILRLKTCFRWKGARPSGVLRLDVTLFSGFELLAMNGISVDDTGNETDVHHGARGDRVWVVMNNVSSRCAVCVHFAARSSHVISGLRPAFARVYPAARSDLASETFFHTHRGSTLLAGITEDDIVTWFGRSEDAGETPMSSSFKGICECGKKCSSATAAATAATPQQSVATPIADAASPSSATAEEDLTTADVLQSSTSTEASSPTAASSAAPRPSSPASPAIPALKAAAASIGRAPTPAVQHVQPQPVSALPDLHYEINRAHQHDTSDALELQLLPDEKTHSTAKTPQTPQGPRGRATNVAHLTSTTIRAPMRGKAAPASLHYHPRAEARTQPAAVHDAAPQPALKPSPLPTQQSRPSPSVPSTVTERPTAGPSAQPTEQPTSRPSVQPTAQPTPKPSPGPVTQTAGPHPRESATPSVATQPAQPQPQHPQGVPVVAVGVLASTEQSGAPSDATSTAKAPAPTPAHQPTSTPMAPKQPNEASTATPTVLPVPTAAEASVSTPPAINKSPVASKKKVPAGGVDRKKAWTPHSVAINTPMRAAQPERPGPAVPAPPSDATTQPAAGAVATPGTHGAAERNPLWGLLREVMGPENANPAEAEVMPSTISEETKDEEQQDEDEAEKEKMSFD